MIERIVSEDAAGQRLDKFLRRVLEAVPLSHIYKLLRTRKVRVNGRRAEGATLLALGDRITVRGDPDELLAPRAPTLAALDTTAFKSAILYEDDQLLACDKPAGLAVHPGSGLTGATLVDLARAYLGPTPDGEFAPSPGHRLDRETSGVVLVARTRRCMVRLTELFTAGEVKKSYLALVKGRFSNPAGTIDIALAEHQQTQRSREEHGVRFQPAVTHYRTIGTGKEVSLLDCRIETGRTHQIRRHFAAADHPVVGDRKHGDFPFNRRLRAEVGLDRMFLHARRLEIVHPTRGTPLRFEAPLAPELCAALERLGIPQPGP